jgi:hypothetical protein
MAGSIATFFRPADRHCCRHYIDRRHRFSFFYRTYSGQAFCDSESFSGSAWPGWSAVVSGSFEVFFRTDERKLLLTSFAMRMPIGVKRRLKKAATLRGVSQTDIILELLDVALPALLGEENAQQQELLAS